MRALVLLCVLLSACTTLPPLAELEASTPELDFETVWPGRTRELPLRVRNTHATARRLRVELDSDLFSAPAELEIQPGTFATLPVRYAPRERGGTTGTLRLVAETAASEEPETLQVTLRGVSDLPACPVTTPCHVGRFDLEREACVEELAEDGTACAVEACSGTCRQARCDLGAGLAVAWSYRPGPSRLLTFPGLGDAEGNLYWLEHDAATPGRACEVVSVDRDGALRYRMPLGYWWGCTSESSLLLAGGDQIVLWGPGNF